MTGWPMDERESVRVCIASVLVWLWSWGMIWEDLQCPLGGEIERRGWLSVPRLCGVDRVDNVSLDIVRGNRWVVQWIFAIAADHFSSRSVQWTFALHFLGGFNSLNSIELTLDFFDHWQGKPFNKSNINNYWRGAETMLTIHTYTCFFLPFSWILQSLDLGGGAWADQRAAATITIQWWAITAAQLRNYNMIHLH